MIWRQLRNKIKSNVMHATWASERFFFCDMKLDEIQNFVKCNPFMLDTVLSSKALLIRIDHS